MPIGHVHCWELFTCHTVGTGGSALPPCSSAYTLGTRPGWHTSHTECSYFANRNAGRGTWRHTGYTIRTYRENNKVVRILKHWNHAHTQLMCYFCDQRSVTRLMKSSEAGVWRKRVLKNKHLPAAHKSSTQQRIRIRNPFLSSVKLAKVKIIKSLGKSLK